MGLIFMPGYLLFIELSAPAPAGCADESSSDADRTGWDLPAGCMARMRTGPVMVHFSVCRSNFYLFIFSEFYVMCDD
jgi:hypothetical protein